jgi:hypothetical protein
LLRKLFSCMLKLSIFASFILFLNQLNFKISSQNIFISVFLSFSIKYFKSFRCWRTTKTSWKR